MENSYTPVDQNMVMGTSFHGVVLEVPYVEVVKKIGEPHLTFGGGKVQFEWCFRGPGGRVVTLYDWKQYGNQYPAEWHVGGKDEAETVAFRTWFEGLVSA